MGDAPATLPPILILNTHLPVFPGGGGVEALTTRHLAGLSEQVGLVSLAHSATDLEQARPLAAAGVELYLWRSPAIDAPAGGSPAALSRSLRARVAPGLQALVDRLRAGRDRPADTFVLDRGFRNLSAGLWQALCKREWPIVIVVESTAAAFLGFLPRPQLSVLVMHDLRALLYERQALAAGSARERRHLEREARRYRAFERHWCRQYDLVVTVSPHDADWVRRHYEPRRVITVPLPVDANYFRPAPPESERPGRIVFTGLMNHPPNADAAVFFAHEVLPRVRAQVPEAHFQVVGRHPLPRVQALAALRGVEVTGAVPDVRPHLAAASVVIVPLRFGSGARQKILEAWCLRKCIVTTSLGAEGLQARNGESVLVADGAEALAEQVTRALRDPALRDRVRDAGRAVARAGHDPARVALDYAGELASAWRERTSGRGPLRVLVDLRHLRPGTDAALQRDARALLRALLALSDNGERYTILVSAAVRREFRGPARGSVRFVCDDDLATRFSDARARAWQATRGALGIFRDVSEEVRLLRRLHALDATWVYAPSGSLAPDLVPLRHVLLVSQVAPDPIPSWTTSLRRATLVLTAADTTRTRLIEHFGLAPERIVSVPPPADPAHLSAVLTALGGQRDTQPIVSTRATTWNCSNGS